MRHVVVLGLLAPAGITSAEATLEQQIIAAQGIDKRDQISRIQFEFVVDREGREVVRRAWDWRPQDGTTLMTSGTDAPTSITLFMTESDAGKKVEANWINDTFWLMFPIHLAWGTEDTVTDLGEAPAPISGVPTRKVLIAYPASGGGVTPGDQYDLFLDPATMRPVEWNYRKGGKESSRPLTWEDYKTAGPLTLSTRHRSKDGALELRMENLRVETGE